MGFIKSKTPSPLKYELINPFTPAIPRKVWLPKILSNFGGLKFLENLLDIIYKSMCRKICDLSFNDVLLFSINVNLEVTKGFFMPNPLPQLLASYLLIQFQYCYC